MNLYHITLKCHVRSIRKGGLDPRWSTGHRRAIYLVDASMVTWAVAHVAMRHGQTVAKLVIMPVEVQDSQVKKTCKQGVYYVDFPLWIGGIPVQSAFSWLNAEEESFRRNNDDDYLDLQERLADAAL